MPVESMQARRIRGTPVRARARRAIPGRSAAAPRRACWRSCEPCAPPRPARPRPMPGTASGVPSSLRPFPTPGTWPETHTLIHPEHRAVVAASDVDAQVELRTWNAEFRAPNRELGLEVRPAPSTPIQGGTPRPGTEEDSPWWPRRLRTGSRSAGGIKFSAVEINWQQYSCCQEVSSSQPARSSSRSIFRPWRMAS